MRERKKKKKGKSGKTQLWIQRKTLNPNGHIIEESHSLATKLRMVFFTHTKRKGNNVADKLTKLVKNLYEPQVWLEDIHSNVTDLVTFDRSFLHS